MVVSFDAYIIYMLHSYVLGTRHGPLATADDARYKLLGTNSFTYTTNAKAVDTLRYSNESEK